MDLRLSGAVPSPAEREAIDTALGGGTTRDLLLPALHAAQETAGWVSRGALEHICMKLDIPPAEAYGVASFYMMLSLTPRPADITYVCEDVVCRLAGAGERCAELTSRLGPENSSSGPATWKRFPCLGQCDRAPAVLRIAKDAPVARTLPAERAPQAGGPGLRLLGRMGRVDPSSLDSYKRAGGYAALAKAFAMGAEAIIKEITTSGLSGRGGAAFPTGRKWEAVAREPAPRYLVCNADESEPGTFKDGLLMEGDPFALVEAMTIAAFATGCERGYVYIRGEYPAASAVMQDAIDQARAAGLLGSGIQGSRFSFDIELRRGAGAYICGEETALFNSIEGKRGEPRNKPPFPTTHGLFGRPTLINNVETLFNVLPILTLGAKAFASFGSRGSPGTRLFCLSGDVARPGVYEVPLGTTLGKLLGMAGGVAQGARLQAILLGGAAGTFVGPEALEMPLSLEDARAAGATLGSGAVIVFDDRADLERIVRIISEFFKHESCGQCVPCRVGTVRQDESLSRLATILEDGPRARELTLLSEVGQVMRDASICGLGQTASSAVLSAITRFNLFQKGGLR